MDSLMISPASEPFLTIEKAKEYIAFSQSRICLQNASLSVKIIPPRLVKPFVL